MSSEKCNSLRSVVGFINKTFERLLEQKNNKQHEVYTSRHIIYYYKQNIK